MTNPEQLAKLLVRVEGRRLNLSYQGGAASLYVPGDTEGLADYIRKVVVLAVRLDRKGRLVNVGTGMN